MRIIDHPIADMDGGTGRRRPTAPALFAILSLAACHPAHQSAGMEAKDLSDDRGARAGRFRPAPDNAAVANDSGPADNGTTVESNQ